MERLESWRRTCVGEALGIWYGRNVALHVDLIGTRRCGQRKKEKADEAVGAMVPV